MEESKEGNDFIITLATNPEIADVIIKVLNEILEILINSSKIMALIRFFERFNTDLEFDSVLYFINHRL